MRRSMMADPVPRSIEPMLATLVAKPFHKDGWVYEEKYDGDRLLAYKKDDRVRLLSRNGKDHTRRYPRIAAAVMRLAPVSLVLDGEVVVFDRKRVSHFQLLQRGEGEPVYEVFDCLYHDGQNLRAKPLSERRRILERVVPSAEGVVALSQRLAADGLEAFAIAKRRGYEGIVAKNLSAPYTSGRSTQWLKVKVHREDEFLIVGYTAPEGSREYFGALLLGAYDARQLHYVGKVGTGFDRETLAALHRKFQPLVRRTTPLVDPPKGERKVTYLSPKLIAQIAYEEWTSDRRLRQPVYLGLRDDKRPSDVTLEEAGAP